MTAVIGGGATRQQGRNKPLAGARTIHATTEVEYSDKLASQQDETSSQQGLGTPHASSVGTDTNEFTAHGHTGQTREKGPIPAPRLPVSHSDHNHSNPLSSPGGGMRFAFIFLVSCMFCSIGSLLIITCVPQLRASTFHANCSI